MRRERIKRPYLLRKRGRYWYYRLAEEQTFHSTGETSRNQAEVRVLSLMGAADRPDPGHQTIREYSKDLWVWGRCQHIERVLDEGGSMSKRYARMQRYVFEKHLLPDPLLDQKLSETRRGDILAFRSRKRDLANPPTVNKAIGQLKIIFGRALYEEAIENDPTAGIRRLKYKRAVRGGLTLPELQLLFPGHGTGPWESIRDCTCFLLATVTGMRRGEVLALCWRNVDFDDRRLAIVESWADVHEKGDPKWDHKRDVPLPEVAIARLEELREDSLHSAPDELVFCYDDGQRLGEHWWANHFADALQRIGLDAAEREERGLVPHSLRHSVNTHLVDAGYDKEKIRTTFGWMDESTQDGYLRRDMLDVREQAKIIDSWLRPS